MKSPDQMSRTAKLVEGALMVAMAFALSAFPIYSYPWGGSITLCSTLPLVVMSMRHGGKWGLGTAAVYSLMQMMQGMKTVLYLKTFLPMLLCILLDYVLAYTVLGLTGTFARRFKNGTAGLAAGMCITGVLRYFCSFLSGVILWRQYAWEGWPVWGYSAIYNLLWWLPDFAIALVATLLLSRASVLHLLPQRAKSTV